MISFLNEHVVSKLKHRHGSASSTKSDKEKKPYEWSYEGECGPQTWPKHFSGAKGKHQSPINIETEAAVYDESLEENGIDVLYGAQSCCQIKNTGHSFQVDGFPYNRSKVAGGPIANEYSFLQFHMHWGNTCERGSEHLIDGYAYAAELHFVNWNNGKFTDPKAASESNKNDGLLVLGVLVELGEFNEEFEKVSQCLHDIHLKDEHVPVHHIDLRRLLPNDLSKYWTYKGSLTTPPCSECVTWVVFVQPIRISKEQLEKCHMLYDTSKDEECNQNTLIKYNDRPVCKMGNRVVRKSFN